MIDQGWIKKQPKAELHVHLEGSIGMETLNLLAQRKGLGPLQSNPYIFDGFDEFNKAFVFLAQFLTEEEDFFQVALDFVARQAAENILYTEVFFMPLFHLSRAVPAEALIRGVAAGLAEGEKRHKVHVKLIYSIPRIIGPESGMKTLDFIKNYPDDRVIAIDLAGTESENDVALFADIFKRARAMGLKTVAHAGEFSSPEHIRQSLDLLGAQRIGHGISAQYNKTLMRRLADEGIVLEISPTSNVKLKVVSVLHEHPVRRFFEMGIPLVISTDDPAVFNTTLSDELMLLKDHLGFKAEEIRELINNSFNYSFLDETTRRAILG
ncbi:MAG: adenosine deaminase [Thermodesulfobacteriota bacterium]|nr:adenosine deaminase [Thermodesulfobacteriota bacterium]